MLAKIATCTLTGIDGEIVECESDISKGWLSSESPLGRGLLGKELGEIAKTAPDGLVGGFQRKVFCNSVLF